MKSIFHYIDYRRFLSDYYNEKKATTRHFSYRYFCGKAGITSPTFLKLVMEGKSNISVAMIDKFSVALKLNKKEARYFKHLVLFNQSPNADDKQEHYAVLVSMNNNVSQRVLGSEQFEYLSKWHTVVIRELICQYDYKDDFKAIASSVVPPVSKRDAAFSVKLLRRLGLVIKNPDGTYCHADRVLATNRDVAGPAIRAFNKTMIELAHKSVDTVDNTRRHVSGNTMGISRECFDVLCAEIEAFKERIAAIADNSAAGDRVYQLNVQLFPIGQTPEAGAAVSRPGVGND
jgi:uncharacterized protein (TIGR02147 family)